MPLIGRKKEVAELEHRNTYSGAVTNQITMDALFEQGVKLKKRCKKDVFFTPFFVFCRFGVKTGRFLHRII